MHLAREADRLQRAQRLARATSEVGDRAGHRGRPVVGILLRPAGARTVGRIGPGGARDRLAALVGQKRLEPGGSAVKPEIHGLALCSAAAALTSGSGRSRAKRSRAARLCLARSMPPSLAAGGQWRRRRASPTRDRRRSRPVRRRVRECTSGRKGSAGRRRGSLRSTPSQSRSPACREKRRTRPAANRPLVRFRFSASRENASREIAADRGDRRAGDVRIGAGPDDLADDHGQRSFSRGRDASYANRICSQRVIARKNLFISRKSTFRQRNVNDLSYCSVCAAA